MTLVFGVLISPGLRRKVCAVAISLVVPGG